MINNKVEEIKEHIAEIMRILEIPITESNKNTPLRVAKMWCNELFLNRNNSNMEQLRETMKLFPNNYGQELIVVRDIPFSSICEHHWLPFSGIVTVGYVPKDTIVGLSKIPRVVKYFSKQPQLQEKLTKDIGDYLFDLLDPYAMFVEVTAKHQCVMCRGAESDCETRTHYTKYGYSSTELCEKAYADFTMRMNL